METRLLERIIMVVIITAVVFGASYNIITADQFTERTDAILVMQTLTD